MVPVIKDVLFGYMIVDMTVKLMRRNAKVINANVQYLLLY
jgi:hypothetical protein